MIKFNDNSMKHYNLDEAKLRTLLRKRENRFNNLPIKVLWSETDSGEKEYRDYEIMFRFGFAGSTGQFAKEFNNVKDLVNYVEQLDFRTLRTGYVDVTGNAYAIKEGIVDKSEPLTQYGVTAKWRYLYFAYGLSSKNSTAHDYHLKDKYGLIGTGEIVKRVDPANTGL